MKIFAALERKFLSVLLDPFEELDMHDFPLFCQFHVVLVNLDAPTITEGDKNETNQMRKTWKRREQLWFIAER